MQLSTLVPKSIISLLLLEIQGFCCCNVVVVAIVVTLIEVATSKVNS